MSLNLRSSSVGLFRHLIPLALLAAAFPSLAAAPAELPSADQVMTQAKARAAAEHKNILLVFSASWCGPCHLFERFLADPAIKPSIDKSFVIAHLDVGEKPGDPRHADSPGAVAYEATLAGNNPGYPFLVMLDPAGSPIVNSLRPDKHGKPGDNIGYPAVPVEIDWFMQMLAKGAPGLTPQETATIRQWLNAHAHE